MESSRGGLQNIEDLPSLAGLLCAPSRTIFNQISEFSFPGMVRVQVIQTHTRYPCPKQKLECNKLLERMDSRSSKNNIWSDGLEI